MIDIVIVDDSPDKLEILDLILSDKDYKVSTYLNAELALKGIGDQSVPRNPDGVPFLLFPVK